MPIYEYKCSRCDRQFEVMQKFSDLPLEKCEECGGSVQKQVSLSSFALKGSGWYTTDYKRAPAQVAQANKKADSPSQAQSEGKPESKPDVKSESKPESKPEAQAAPKPAVQAASSKSEAS